ncbi:MAG: aminoacyltransferase [Actinomycetota bacterium]|nr:aminoacyltransferase [Actinomycetota bacterium]
MPSRSLTVRRVPPEQHLAYVASLPSASFLQCPSWGAVKAEWRAESLGWFDGETMVGAGLVLYRQLPKLRRYLAYLPEGPLLDWASEELAAWLDPMVAHLRTAGAFAVRMGPPVAVRRWHAETVKRAIAAGTAKRLSDLPPDQTAAYGDRVAATLASAGWRPPADEGGFGAGQPRYVFQVPLGGRTEDDLLKGFNQLWRRNIKKAEKSGVEVTEGGPGDLERFHALYVETARRDGFTPRPLTYFQRMCRALTAEDPRRLRLYLARHEGDLVAATTMAQVGEHAWYSYGASSTAKRDVRGSNAIQWRMMRDALARGATVYDLRGITDTIDESDPHFGLIQFKLGTGGEAVEYLGEWDLPLNRLLFKAFETYLARR